ncbi:MAG: type II secretion system protein [Aquabacterium sp.]|nr:type II secretion system protein [Aquabacterium sp.]
MRRIPASQIAQRGTSLLEMICAITIMGSVSATALPAFVDLPAEARKSVLAGLDGAVQSASVLMHVKCATQADCQLSAGRSVLNLPSGSVHMERGYPQGGNPAGIESALQLSGFTAVHVADRTIFQKDGAPQAANCAVSYTSPQTDGGLPIISVDTSGC